ncbi:MAG: ABC transporter substrate-binding protein [Nitrospira sp.]|nr:ABC transporter substrate-binding protein [Nitrospira sp.]MDH5497854.1 ABC transporter substrate-binding protein [Nitrospira sp.]
MMISAFLLLWMAGAIGCTQAGEETDRAPTVLVFKHGKLSGDGRVLSDLLRDFERRHPGVIVREELLPADSDRQHQYYAMNLDGGKAPFDLLGIDTIWAQEFAKAGWIASLDGLLPPAERNQFFPGPIEAATFNGRLYAVPWYVDTGVLYYRRDLLDRHGLEPPRTWSDLTRIARTVLDAEQDSGLAGFLWQGKQYEGLMCIALEVLRSNGTDLWSGDRDRAEYGLQFLRETISTYRITPLSTSMADEESTRWIFGEGHALFMRNWPYAWSMFQQEGSPVRGKVGVVPLPSFSGFSSAPVLGGWMLAMPNSSTHREVVGELIQFLTSADTQRMIAIELGYNPVRRALYDEESLLELRPLLKDLYPILLSAQPRPVTPYYLLLSQAVQPEISAVVVGRKSPAEALDAIRRRVDQIMGDQASPAGLGRS